jgi:hypothetical protein
VENLKTLYLTLKKEWFDQIIAGTKTSEYREVKKYWNDRLLNPDGTFKKYDVIHFKNGYNPDSPFMIVELKEIKIYKEKINWFKSNKYYELVLGDILETGNLK